MGELICIRHPEYRGDGSPTLSCKTCCVIFTGKVRQRNASRAKFSGPQAWLNAETTRGDDGSTTR